MSKVLLAEDDSELAFLIQKYLINERFSVEVVADGNEAADRLKHYQYDVVLLDWTLPGASGTNILKAFREAGGTTPVLMLTARDTLQDKTTGFEIGADDYLTKPFFMEELTLRVRSLLRRAQVRPSNALSARDVTLDPSTGVVTKGGAPVMLNAKEYALLEFLLRNQQLVYSAEALLDKVWSSESDTSPETVRTYVCRLRDKFDQPGEQSLIQTIRGIGYKIDP